MTRFRAIVLILILSISFIQCSSIKIISNYDKDVDFSHYKTYYFVRPGAHGKKTIRNPLFTKEIIQEIRPIMEAKGFTEATDQKQTDLLLVFRAFIKNQRNWVAPTYRVGRWGRTWRTSPGHITHYKEGTLAIDIIDRVKKDLVWQGIGKGVLDRDKPARNLIEAVEKILEPFPPNEK